MEDRLNKEYSTWRKSILKRDKNKCQFPGCKRRRALEVHHIIPWSISASLRFEPSNGITLCKKCHKSIKGKENMYTGLFNTIVQVNKK